MTATTELIKTLLKRTSTHTLRKLNHGVCPFIATPVQTRQFYISSWQRGQERSHQYGGGSHNNSTHRWKYYTVSLVSGGLALSAYNYFKQKCQHASCAAKIIDDRAEVEDKEATPPVSDWETAVTEATKLCLKIKDETGSPGLSVSVTVNGKNIWNQGFGHADLENRLPCGPHTVMRIASISKCIAITIVAKLWEQGKLDWDKPVQTYINTWPQKTFQGQKVDITTRQLVSHLSGVRHYSKNCGTNNTQDNYDGKTRNKPSSSTTAVKDPPKTGPDDDHPEFYSKKKYSSVTESLGVFMNDDLCSKPGSEFSYSTHGWTVVSAVAEGASGSKYPTLCRDLFKDLGLEDTFLDESSPLIYNRARQYVKNKNGRIINAAYVDNSNKWAGGGLLSTTSDLAKLGNVMLYSYQHRPVDGASSLPPGYLKPATMDMVWAPVPQTKCSWDSNGKYGMGWAVVTPGGPRYGQCKEVRQYFSHTGAAVGGSGALIVVPDGSRDGGTPPRGVVVAMIANMNGVGLSKTALKIASLFENV